MNKIIFILNSFFDIIKYVSLYIYFKIRRKKIHDVWLISERGVDARDNGYCFYKYMKKKHPEQQIKYVISKDSADYKKIEKEDIVIYRSIEHYYYFLYSKILISAEIMGFSPNESLFYRLNKYGLLKISGKTVFLQHGITKDYNPYMNQKNTKLDLFICGAIPEYNYMITKYGYTEKTAKLTGFSRFDNLTDKKEKIILVMPTWRKWLKYAEKLTGTEFYKNYMDLLNDKELISVLEKNNYKIIFYPHIIFQKHISEFKSKSTSVIIADFKNYDVQDLLKRSELLVTDYSSVAFDYAYMHKKVLYYQFDLEKYREEQYSDGYYNYENDGFGPICYEYYTLKTYLINFLNNKTKFEEYDSRVNNFFKYTDFNNNSRIFKEIKMISKGDKI